MVTGRSRPLRVTLTLALVTLSIAVVGHAVDGAVTALRGGSAVDYLSVASAGRLAHAGSHCLYCLAPLRDSQAQLLGYRPLDSPTFPIPFVDPPLVAWLLQPLALLSLQAGTDIFVVLSLVAMAIAAALLHRRLPSTLPPALRLALVVGSVFSVAAATGLVLGQWDGLLLLAAVVALGVAGRRPLLAGILLGVLLLKPQVIWVLPAVLIIGRQWRMLAGFTITALVWAVSSLWLVGADHVHDLVDVLTSPAYSALNAYSSSVPGIVTRVAGSSRAAYISASVLWVVVVGVIWWRARHRLRVDRDAVIAIGLGASILVAPHLGDYSLILLAIPIVVWARRAPLPALLFVVALNAASFLEIVAHGSSDPASAVIVAAAAWLAWRGDTDVRNHQRRPLRV